MLLEAASGHDPVREGGISWEKLADISFYKTEVGLQRTEADLQSNLWTGASKRVVSLQESHLEKLPPTAPHPRLLTVPVCVPSGTP